MNFRKRILEIGHGGSPLGGFTIKRLAKILPEDIFYIGIDHPCRKAETIMGSTSIDEMFIRRIHEAQKDLHAQKPANIILIDANARQLPFAPDFFDEIHLHFFVSDPYVTPEDIWIVFKNSFRALRNNGALIITGEDNPFALMFNDDQTPRSVVAYREAASVGFNLNLTESELVGLIEFPDLVSSILDNRKPAAAREHASLFSILGIKQI